VTRKNDEPHSSVSDSSNVHCHVGMQLQDERDSRRHSPAPRRTSLGD